MYIKELIISSPLTPNKPIQKMKFKKGMNLIIDDTPLNDSRVTGNNVGKTTVLKLIDFCLGAKPKIIYADEENKKKNYEEVKDFLVDNKIEIKLVLSEDLDNPSAREVCIERNFLPARSALRQINGKSVSDKAFTEELESHIFPKKEVSKPSFRQIISHNIRYQDHSINNTIKTLNKFTSNVEYETLYLYLLGCNTTDGELRQSLTTKIKQEENFKKRLEEKETKSTYEVALSLIDSEIDRLNAKKASFNLNENYEKDLEELNSIKYHLNKKSSQLSKLKIKRTLIEQSVSELEENYSEIDLNVLKLLYQEATLNVSTIQKSFEDLVAYHNTMILEKIKFISQDLPSIKASVEECEHEISDLLQKEKTLTDAITKGNSFEELEKVIFDLNEQYRRKGEYEGIIAQLNEVEEKISVISSEIEKIDDNLFSEDFENKLKAQLKKFNEIFSQISFELYGERYALKYEINEEKGRPTYVFNAFNTNLSSGKKQGEILCFDLASILFARSENLPTFNFLLNDKKELMHDNQLIKVSNFVHENDIQLVFSILKDKLPDEILSKSHEVVKLSQESKLFKIEQGNL